MNYELAKELEEAKFPFNVHRIKYDSTEVLMPTLSELIEACGTGFRHLSRADYSADTWTAQGNPLEKFILGNGTTPEEAVAHLWLSLQKK